MRTIKPYLSLIALAFVCSTYAQSNITINGRTYTLTRNPLAFEDFRVRSQFNLPTTLRSTADASALAFSNNRPQVRRVINGTETWVYLLDSTDIVSSGQAKLVFQYSDNVNVTVGDTTTALVLNQTTPNSASRVVTLKDVALFSGTELSIYNYNSSVNLNTLSTNIIDKKGDPITTLKNETVYTLTSDGSYWRILSETPSDTSGGGGGGGGSNGIIVNLD